MFYHVKSAVGIAILLFRISRLEYPRPNFLPCSFLQLSSNEGEMNEVKVISFQSSIALLSHLRQQTAATNHHKFNELKFCDIL